MSTEPLNVRVARALGWTEIHEELQGRIGGWFGTAPACTGPRWWTGNDPILPYGEDTPEGWACTGPLMKQYAIGVWPRENGQEEGRIAVQWGAKGYGDARSGPFVMTFGASGPEAAALCLLALHEAGRLKP